MLKVARPASVALYNQFMGGVDKTDMLIAFYKYKCKTSKWYQQIVRVPRGNKWVTFRLLSFSPDKTGVILKAVRMYYTIPYSFNFHNLGSSFFFMKQAGRKDIHTLESKIFISWQSTFF